MITVSVADFAEVVADVTAGLATQSDPLEFLQVFTHRVAAVVDLSVVGLLAAEDKGTPPAVAASDKNSERLALFQLQSQEGPCLDALHTAEPVVMADLRAPEAPWPRFAPYAATAGYRSVHAFPLGPRSTAFGAVGVFGSDVGVLDRTDAQVVRALTDVAAVGLVQHRAIRRSELLAAQLQHALNSRIVIEQAKGVIAQANRIDVDTAFELIRAYARRSNRRLADIAGVVVTGLTNLPLNVTPDTRRAERRVSGAAAGQASRS
jgi:transcriptional regulator with GAF, ATPase, and Fis domain